MGATAFRYTVVRLIFFICNRAWTMRLLLFLGKQAFISPGEVQFGFELAEWLTVL